MKSKHHYAIVIITHDKLNSLGSMLVAAGERLGNGITLPIDAEFVRSTYDITIDAYITLWEHPSFHEHEPFTSVHILGYLE